MISVTLGESFGFQAEGLLEWLPEHANGCDCACRA